MREFPTTMDFYERIDAAFKQLGVNRAQVGRETGVSGQAVTQKLQRKSAVSPAEITVYARHAQMSVSEALGDGSVVLEVKDEQDLIELYRMLTPDQRRLIFDTMRQLAAQPVT
jgi:transcriptional regulator with XRE-family HTH domain